jgi:hypothetical protein
MNNFEVITLFKYTHYVINKNLEGITDEEALKIPDGKGNCINWIMGHIVFNRDSAMETAGIDKLCTKEFEELYKTGTSLSEPSKAVKISKMIELINKSQELLMKKFNEVDFCNEEKKMEWFIGIGFHEAYHAGQIGILRKISGK